MLKVAKIAVLGAAALDTIVKVDNFPSADEIVFPQSINKYPGGSTANIAVGLKRLGLETSFLGKIGDDTEGSLIKEDFIKEGVDTSYLCVEKDSTSAQAFIAVNNSGERVIYSLGGTALYDQEAEIDQVDFSDFAGLYIGEVLTNIGLKVINKAKEFKTPIFYSPGGIFSALGLKEVGYLVKNSDYLLLNLPELKLLSGYDHKEDAIQKLLNYGARNLVVTEGVLGSGFYSNDSSFFVEAFKVKAVDSTGAGDSFTSGFITGIYAGYKMKECLRLGNACAAFTVMKMGARTAMPRLCEVINFIG